MGPLSPSTRAAAGRVQDAGTRERRKKRVSNGQRRQTVVGPFHQDRGHKWALTRAGGAASRGGFDSRHLHDGVFAKCET